MTGFPITTLKKIYLKKNKVNNPRKNRNKTYYGVLRVTVKKSADINRKVTGWIEGFCFNFKVKS